MRNGPYELVIAPDDYPGKRYRGRYCYKHHLVWWRRTGEVPGPGELVHHKNGKKRDNRFRNLEKKTRAAHSAEHSADRGEKISVVCGRATCSKVFVLVGSKYRKRKAQSRSGLLFCSLSCSVTQQQLVERFNIAR